MGQAADEYLETIYRLEKKTDERIKTREISRQLRVSEASVSEMLKKLQKRGLVSYELYKGVRLTPKGKKQGKKILRKHRLLERFLQFIGVKEKQLHKEACKLEHVISDDVEKALESRLEADDHWIDKKIVPITKVRERKKCRVAYVEGGRMARQRLSDMGLVPDAEIEVKRSSSFKCPVEVSVKGSFLCIGLGLADKVHVEVLD